MRVERKRRLFFILFILVGISVAMGFALFALRHNIDLYYTPSQLLKHPSHHIVRLGGLVVKGSVHHQQKTLTVSFMLTDFHRKVMVQYQGVLPSLFCEGQGIVAEGHLNASGVFIADQVLANPIATEIPTNKKRIKKRRRLRSTLMRHSLRAFL